LLAWSHGIACLFGDTASASEHALEHARLAGDVRQERRSATSYGGAAVFGPTPVHEAIDRCTRMLEAVAGDRLSEGWLLVRLASLHAMRGAFDEGRELGLRGIRMLEELGLDTEVVFLKVELWRVEMAAGDLAAAERYLRDGYEHLVEIGEKYLLSTVAGLLAQTLFELGRTEEVVSLADLCQELAGDDDVDSQALWRCVRGKLLAHQGRREEAEALVRQALDLLEPTDAVLFKVGALLDVAYVLAVSGDDDSRIEILSRAHELAEAKGDLVAASYVKALQAGVAA
jgi:tetratricopeptide (TPR) repeat protein